MAESGDWLVPRYQGAPFFDKPPLTYWLTAASFTALGAGLAAGRLVAVVSALAVLGATMWLGRLLFDARTSFRAGIVLATTLLFLSFGRVAMSDMLLTLWCTLTVGLGVRVRQQAAPSTTATAGIGACLGLGFLTKGPIAIVLAGAGLLVVAIIEGRPRAVLRPRGVAAALLAFSVLGLGWFVAVWLRLGWGPLAWFFLRENLERFAGEAYDSGRSPLYYVWTFLAVGLPWSLVFPIAAVRERRSTRILLAWMVAMAIPLSLSRGKIDYYLLPLFPPASLVVGRYLAATPWRGADRLWARVVLAAVALALAVLPLFEARVPVEWLPPAAAQILFVAVVLAAGCATALAALRPTPARVLASLGGAMWAIALVVAAFFLPAFRAAQPNAAVVADVSRERSYRPEARVAICADPARVRRDLLFAVRLAPEERCDVWSLAAARTPFLLIVSSEHWLSLGTAPTLREVATYRALPATALTLSGMLAGPEPEAFVLFANFATDDPVAEIKRRQDRKRALRAAEAAWQASQLQP